MSKRRVAIVAAAFAIAVGGAAAWLMRRAPETDDAYLYADSIDVVPEVSGRIIELNVRDDQPVRQGDVLFRIDPRAYEHAVAEALARVVALDVRIQRSVSARRQVGGDPGPPLKPEPIAVSGTEALAAKRAVAASELATAELDLERTVVRAPFDGRVVSLKASVGGYASAQKPIFSLVDARRWYVVANLRETELKRVQPGAPSTVRVVADASRRFRGTVEGIGHGAVPQDGGGAPGRLGHALQRFPVKIRIEQPDPELFRVGASAVVVVHRGEGDQRTE